MTKMCICAKMWINADECEDVENFGGGDSFHIKNTISQWKWCFFSGPDRIRTDDPHNANVVRSQLRYKPITIFF